MLDVLTELHVHASAAQGDERCPQATKLGIAAN